MIQSNRYLEGSGIYSARWGGKNSNFKKQLKVYKELSKDKKLEIKKSKQDLFVLFNKY